MMTNLFSSFDPISNKLQMNWIIMMMPMLMYPSTYWISKSRYNMLFKLMENKMIKEIKNITHHKEMLILSKSIFLIIMTFNIMGLFPYNFTPTSHMSVTISLAMPMWMMLMTYGWLNQTNNLMIHMLPMNTPKMLMPMMILIETIGLLIRPISLSVRLTANMIAGHMIMTLLGNMNKMSVMLFMIMMTKMILLLFETSISMIQAYVFMTLTTLYSSEIPYET